MKRTLLILITALATLTTGPIALASVSPEPYIAQTITTRQNLEAQLLALQAENEQLKQELSQYPITGFQYLHLTERTVLAFLIMLLLLGLGDCWLKPRNAQSTQENETQAVGDWIDDEDDEASEYDYLNSDDALQAKLNMAHAFLEMRDETSARPLIEEVLASGSPEQQLHAQALYSRCSPESDASGEEDLKPLN